MYFFENINDLQYIVELTYKRDINSNKSSLKWKKEKKNQISEIERSEVEKNAMDKLCYWFRKPGRNK